MIDDKISRHGITRKVIKPLHEMVGHALVVEVLKQGWDHLESPHNQLLSGWVRVLPNAKTAMTSTGQEIVINQSFQTIGLGSG